jgi:hypothetical protein
MEDFIANKDREAIDLYTNTFLDVINYRKNNKKNKKNV